MGSSPSRQGKAAEQAKPSDEPVAPVEPVNAEDVIADLAGTKDGGEARPAVPTAVAPPAPPPAGFSLDLSHISTQDNEMLTARRAAGDEEQFRQESTLLKCLQEYSRFAPGVYVCGHEMANRLDGVRALGITAVVNVAAECFPCPFEAEGMQYAAFSVNDSPNEDVTCLFHTVIEIIEAVASAGGATLIHCQYGVSRSASFGIAYLMWRFGLSCADGIAAAVNARGCVNPNPGFVAQLLEWEKLIPQLPGRSTAGGRPQSSPLWFKTCPAPTVSWISASLADVVALRRSRLLPLTPPIGSTSTPSTTSSPPDMQAPASAIVPSPGGRVSIPRLLTLVRSLDDHRPIAPTPQTLTSDPSTAQVVLGTVSPEVVSYLYPLGISLTSGTSVITLLLDEHVSGECKAAADSEIARWRLFSSSSVPASPPLTVTERLVEPASVSTLLSTLCASANATAPIPSDAALSSASLSVLIGDSTAVITVSFTQPSATASEPPTSSILPAITLSGPVAPATLTEPSPDESADSTVRSSAISSLPSLPLVPQDTSVPLPAPRRAAGPVEDTPTPAVDDAPKLFKFDSSGWSHLGVFDNDDLESDGLFALLVPAVDGEGPSVFGWLGSEYSPDPPVVGMAAADAAKQCLASFALTAVGTNANVTLVLEGEESDQFWEVFDY